ncbi:MAG: dockerin type I repeat-containing protein [Lachnospiraceae bacterium]|nr:dockerin type I repeat-containing protein [Lachnospiraceae bacterium]
MRNLKKFMTILLAAGLICALFSTTALAWLAGDITYDANGFYTTSFGIVYYQPPMKNLDGAYAISNIGQLFWFAALVNGDTEQTDVAEAVPDADAVLTVDIAIPEGYEWTPIGYNYDSESETGGYTGSFDGQGYAVSGVCINADAADGGYYGLFGYVAGGTVENVILKDCSISVSAADGVAVRVGGIAGAVSGTVSNCESSGTVGAGTTGEYSRVGGIVGSVYSSGTVSNCESSAVVSGAATDSRAYAGGIAGDASGTVGSCASSGRVSATATGERSYAGGIVGNANSNSTVSNCENSGTVSAMATDEDAYAGGIAAVVNSSTVSSCENSGTVSASVSAIYNTSGNCFVSAGGIAGHTTNTGTISECENSGDISGNISDYITGELGDCWAWVGGITGDVTGGSCALNCKNSGDINAINLTSTLRDVTAGGVVGRVYNGEISGCYSIGMVSAVAPYGDYAYSHAGSIAGRDCGTVSASVSAIYNTSGNCFVSAGGIAGHTTNTGTISECENSGDISGNISDYITGELGDCWAWVGGITGDVTGGSCALNCKNSGDINAINLTSTLRDVTAGGVVGRVYNGEISGCYSIGMVSAVAPYGDYAYSHAGSIAGRDYGILNPITNCCYLGDTVSADQIISYYGTALTAAEFANGTALSLLNDGSQVWRQTIGVDAYPYLNITTGTTGSVGTDFDDSDEQDEEKEKSDEQEEPDDTGDTDDDDDGDTGDTGDTEDTGGTDTGGDSSGGTDATTLGDLNGDDEVDAGDLTILARHVGKVETIEDEAYLANADVTGDGDVDASDLTKLAQYVGKIISSLD